MTRDGTRTRTGSSSMSRRAALGLLFGGVGALGFQQSGAYSSTIGERGFGASTAADPDALLGIVGNDVPTITPKLTNNSSYTMDLTLESESVEFDVDDGGFAEPVSFDLSPGEDREFSIDGDDGEVRITAHLTDRDTSTGSIELVRQFVVPAAGAIERIDGSIKAIGGSGKYEFGLTNKSNKSVTLNAFGVPWTDPDADEISPPTDNQATLESAGTDLIEGSIEVGDTEYSVIDDNEVTLDPETGSDDTEVTFEFDRFRKDGKGLGVEDVDLFVRASDGSSTVVELRSDE